MNSNETLIMLGAYIIYRPLHLFLVLAALSFLVGLGASGRLVYYLWFADPALMKFREGTGLLLHAAIVTTLVFLMAGVLGAGVTSLMMIAQDIRSRIRNMELHFQMPPMDCDITVAGEFFRWKKTVAPRGEDSMDASGPDGRGLGACR